MCVCCLTEAWELWAFYKARCDFKNTNKLNIKQKLQKTKKSNPKGVCPIQRQKP